MQFRMSREKSIARNDNSFKCSFLWQPCNLDPSMHLHRFISPLHTNVEMVEWKLPSDYNIITLYIITMTCYFTCTHQYPPNVPSAIGHIISATLELMGM